MNPIILKLSRSAATAQYSNAEWISTIPKSISISDGDSYVIQSAYIDQATSNASFITIEKDVTITFNFVPFITYTEARSVTGQIGSAITIKDLPTDTPFYCAYNPDPNNTSDMKLRYEPYQKTATIKVSAGIYTPIDLATHMTDLMTDTKFGADVNGMPYSSNQFMEYFYKNLSPSTANLPSYAWFRVGLSQTQMYDAVIAEPVINNTGATNQAYVPRQDPVGTPGANYHCYMMMQGCQEIGIEYSGSSFSLFGFTPYVQPKTPPSEWAVSMVYDATQKKYTTKSLAGGIFFTSITDDSDYLGEDFFKKILGIDTSKFCIDVRDFTAGTVQFDTKYGILENYFTKPKSSIAYAFGGINSGVIAQGNYGSCQISYQGTGNNDPESLSSPTGGNYQPITAPVSEVYYPPAFIGNSQVELSAGTHYNISIQSIQQSNMYGKQIDTGVSMILGQSYNYSRTVEGFEQSAVPYTHIGGSMDLQNFHVRIISPDTNLPVEDKFLGPNSYIYLKVLKADRQQITETKK